MAKPLTVDGYSEKVTKDCERVLVTLLRNLGPHRESLVLIGGLTPRYLVMERPPIVPQHAGTLDLDVVIDLVVLEDVEAYRTLEDNLKKIGFERGENDKGQKVNWRWKVKLEDGTTIILELLADHPDLRGGRAQPLPDEGQISALNIPHSSIVFDLYDNLPIRCLQAQKKPQGTTPRNMTPRTSHGTEKENRAPAKSVAAANRAGCQKNIFPRRIA